MPINVLCVDDPYLTDLLRYALGRDGYSARWGGAFGVASSWEGTT